MALNFPAFDQCPKEFSLIGKMLAAYGDLEFDLMNCVSIVHNTDLAIKALFRARGETGRVQVADALARQAYAEAGLESEFSEAIGNFRYCLRVRNQYAHCNWFWRSDIGLGFVDLQDLADTNQHLSKQNLEVYPLDYTLLEAQEGYFGYVQECFRYLANANGRKRNMSLNFVLPRPAKVQQPPQKMPAFLPSRLIQGSAFDTPPEGGLLEGGE